MQHDSSTGHVAPGFGKNSNGLGIFIIAAVFVGIALFCWHLWNNDRVEAKHYRLPAIEKKADGHGDHGGSH